MFDIELNKFSIPKKLNESLELGSLKKLFKSGIKIEMLMISKIEDTKLLKTYIKEKFLILLLSILSNAFKVLF